MIKSAQNKPVSELLNIEANWKFKVPRYQREYVWSLILNDTLKDKNTWTVKDIEARTNVLGKLAMNLFKL
jgi:hypothetical protein